MFLVRFGKKKIEDEKMKELNEWGAKVYSQAYEYYLNLAKEENKNVSTIFNDWWHGVPVSTEEYKANYTKEDHKKAGRIILTAISNGFG